MAYWNNLVYAGPVADSPEVRFENAVLEAAGIGGSATLPGEAFGGPIDEDSDLVTRARSGTLGGASLGKEVLKIPLEGAVEKLVHRVGTLCEA
jgi:hypothetical protein